MNTVLLLIIAIPAVEIFLMIKIGGKIGALNTISLVFLTAIIGVYFARIQGIRTLREGIASFYQNKIPIYELISGASISLAAILLIIPGFFTDFIGFSLLLPFTRNIFLKMGEMGIFGPTINGYGCLGESYNKRICIYLPMRMM